MNNKARLSIITFVFATLAMTATANAQYSYYPLTPCRSVDTRSTGTNGAPALGPNATRNFQIKGTCGVPSTAKAVTLNVTVTTPSTGSWLALWPAGTTYPGISTINFNGGDTLANGAIVGLGSGTLDLSVYNVSGTVQVIIDVTGYFQ